MKLFLASSIHQNGKSIAKRLGKKFGNRVLFISTASETYDDAWWNRADIAKLQKLGFDVEEYSFTGQKSTQVRQKLAHADILCIGGGNTYYLLEKMKKSGAMKPVRDAVKRGLVYIGASAGAVIATKTIENVGDFDNKSDAPGLTSYNSLNLIDIVLFVHWGSKDLEKDGSKTLAIVKKYFKKEEKIIFLRDNQYLEVQDDFYQIITAK